MYVRVHDFVVMYKHGLNRVKKLKYGIDRRSYADPRYQLHMDIKY